MGGNRVACVTGAGGGLGGAITEALVDAGYCVTAFDVDERIAGRICTERPELKNRILPIGGDVRSSNSCRSAINKTIEHFGALHILVNNAGVGLSSIRENYYKKNIKFWEVPDENWDVIIETNVKGAFIMSKAAVPHMLSAGWGRIINVTTSLDTMIRR